MAGWTCPNATDIYWNGIIHSKFVGDGSGLSNVSSGALTISHNDLINVTSDQHHNETHNINTHIMGDNKVIHTKAAGAITEIGLGVAGTFLRSAGEDADMTFAVPTDTTDHTALSNIGTNSHAQVDTHIASSAIHFTSGAIWTDTNANTASGAAILAAHTSSSGALTTHLVDSTDPHGATLTQTNINSLGNVSVSYASVTSGAILGDGDSLSGARLQNIVIGTGSVPPTASNFTRGTIYVEYTP